jgi:hypothetical protein
LCLLLSSWWTPWVRWNSSTCWFGFPFSVSSPNHTLYINRELELKYFQAWCRGAKCYAEKDRTKLWLSNKKNNSSSSIFHSLFIKV